LREVDRIPRPLCARGGAILRRCGPAGRSPIRPRRRPLCPRVVVYRFEEIRLTEKQKVIPFSERGGNGPKGDLLLAPSPSTLTPRSKRRRADRPRPVRTPRTSRPATPRPSPIQPRLSRGQGTNMRRNVARSPYTSRRRHDGCDHVEHRERRRTRPPRPEIRSRKTPQKKPTSK